MKRLVFLCLTLGCGSSPPSDPMDRCQSDAEIRTERMAQSAECEPRPSCPHLGGHPQHDRCADRSGNVAWDGTLLPNEELPNLGDPPTGRAGQGCDVVIEDRYFDALSWDSTQKNRRLWEVKMHDWSNPYKYDGDLKECKLREMIETFKVDCRQIMTCNQGLATEDKLTYVLGFADAGLYYAVGDYLAEPVYWEQ